MIETTGFSRPDMTGVARRQLRLSLALVGLVTLGMIGASIASVRSITEPQSAVSARASTLVRPG
jgi:hypothetical protein